MDSATIEIRVDVTVIDHRDPKTVIEKDPGIELTYLSRLSARYSLFGLRVPTESFFNCRIVYYKRIRRESDMQQCWDRPARIGRGIKEHAQGRGRRII